jgi:Leucine-rich repeat (LRR) protein
MTKLKSLNLSKNIIKDLCEFSESNVPNLENMNISFNSIAQIPKLKFRLKHFIVDFNPL